MRDRKLSNVIFVLKRKIIQTVHEGKKAFKCDICDKDSTEVHEGQKAFKCDICTGNENFANGV